MKVGKSTSLPTSMYKWTMPSLSTSEISSELKGIPSGICAPTAATDEVLYSGYKNRRGLIPTSYGNFPLSTSCKIAEKLIRNMNTSSSGTTIEGFIEGIKKYVRDSHYKIKVIWIGHFYQGAERLVDETDIDLIMEKTIGSWNSVLWTGEYKYDSKRHAYVRKTGHAVAIAGFNTGFNELLVHDPARSDKPVYLKLSQLEGIKIVDLPEDGLYTFRANSTERNGKVLKIIEGAVSFEITR